MSFKWPNNMDANRGKFTCVRACALLGISTTGECALCERNYEVIIGVLSCDCVMLCLPPGVYGDVVRVKIMFNKKDNALVQFTDPSQAQLGTLSSLLYAINVCTLEIFCHITRVVASGIHT